MTCDMVKMNFVFILYKDVVVVKQLRFYRSAPVAAWSVVAGNGSNIFYILEIDPKDKLLAIGSLPIPTRPYLAM